MKDIKKKGSWTISDIPSQRGRLIVVTGTGGLGYVTALTLARAGAEVILAGRNKSKGEAAIEKIQANVTSANIHFEELNLADLASIEAFAKRMRSKHQRLDVLINNAAVMMIPHRQVTKDSFELHFGTNYLGHFALTAHLMPLLRKGRNPRVVNVCALAASSGVINFDDLQSEHQYKPMPVYGQSKLANLIFSLELHRRSVAEKWGVMSIAAHPGLSRSDLVDNGTREKSKAPLVFRLFGSIMLQSAEQGALPTLFASTSSEAVSGQYYGPDGTNERRGFPASAKIPLNAKDVNTAKRLWEASKQLTNVDFDMIASM
ncbi:oxidoreductase [Clostridium estertheticum]|uniref:oxidoreductase n=1 Tax=Clostridium estertheticum TaxID=238834 RepID=UPI001C7CE8D1|nr:oxidoreductase [Clostridium estertheticum]MBX4270069.1 SDR family oxidoreductase [Clostridium estertheticum]WLC80272.1 SDR family oxidoreductase [Clostridium estertheticum]